MREQFVSISDLALVVYQVAERGNIMLGPILAFHLPGFIVLRILPAAIKLVDFLFRLWLYLGITENMVISLLKNDCFSGRIVKCAEWFNLFCSMSNDDLVLIKIRYQNTERLKNSAEGWFRDNQRISRMTVSTSPKHILSMNYSTFFIDSQLVR